MQLRCAWLPIWTHGPLELAQREATLNIPVYAIRRHIRRQVVSRLVSPQMCSACLPKHAEGKARRANRVDMADTDRPKAETDVDGFSVANQSADSTRVAPRGGQSRLALGSIVFDRLGRRRRQSLSGGRSQGDRAIGHRGETPWNKHAVATQR
jgi:hypothetical protein